MTRTPHRDMRGAAGRAKGPSSASSGKSCMSSSSSMSYSLSSRRNESLHVKIMFSPSAQQQPSSFTSAATSRVSLYSSSHGRQRRRERGIGMRQLQQAIKYGVRERLDGGGTGGNGRRSGRSKYTYNGVIFIVEDATRREVTSYSVPFDLPLRYISTQDQDKHNMARRSIHENPVDFCQSHSVLVVDTSGSMRNSDVLGARTRLAAVWYSLAQDFIKSRIESGNAGLQDAISIILMGETATVYSELHNVPTDWLTYNKVMTLYKRGTIQPHGHGCFRPALTAAENILTKYQSSNCALVLAILSDGKPSDHTFQRTSYEKGCTSIVELVGSLSSKLGKRLTVSAIGMGSADQFGTLQEMTSRAKDYGSEGTFAVPSLSTSGIGAAISSIATSLTDTQLTDDGNGLMRGQRPQRRIHVVQREDRRQLPMLTEVVSSDEFDIFMHESVQHKAYDHELDGPNPFRVVPLQHPDAAGVAISKKALGEGTERFAYQFFEVAADGYTVVGEPLIAKTSRFIHEHNEEKESKFLRRFCRINYQSAKVADAFNSRLDSIKLLANDTARVSFLPCSLYMLSHPTKGAMAILVEKRLFGTFQKWNNNNGWKQRPVPRLLLPIPEETVSAQDDFVNRHDDTDVMDEEEDEVEVIEKIEVRDGEVAQAFSHYSYVFGGRKSLICDLQGVYDKSRSLLRFTDPVIHYYDPQKENKKGQYGKTDRGAKGIEDFLDTHTCNALCDLVTTGYLTARES